VTDTTTEIAHTPGTCREGYWTRTYGHQCSRGNPASACAECERWQQSVGIRVEQLQFLPVAHAAELHKPAEPAPVVRQPRDMRRVRRAIRALRAGGA
jgi:hypothetical protein